MQGIMRLSFEFSPVQAEIEDGVGAFPELIL
jgi:hypothetical protein